MVHNAHAHHSTQNSQLKRMSVFVNYTDPKLCEVHGSTVVPLHNGNKTFEVTTHVGLRPNQEDRLILVPQLFGKDVSFCGIFDGTVGDDASEYVCKNILGHLCATEEISNVETGILSFDLCSESNTQAKEAIHSALWKTFVNCDQALIEHCAAKQLDFASSTGVAILMVQNHLAVGHIGDSRACMGKCIDGNIKVNWLTIDHKPNMPREQQRIESCGGSLVWLHGNKPYIRGGDFTRRQALGQHPKQLNYSRAFGGKDLKMYGLSAEPDISHFQLSAEDKVVILGSDGLWDVVNPLTACQIALNARAEGRSATNALVQYAIEGMPRCGVQDNVTAIVIFLDITTQAEVPIAAPSAPVPHVEVGATEVESM